MAVLHHQHSHGVSRGTKGSRTSIRDVDLLTDNIKVTDHQTLGFTNKYFSSSEALNHNSIAQPDTVNTIRQNVDQRVRYTGDLPDEEPQGLDSVNNEAQSERQLQVPPHICMLPT